MTNRTLGRCRLVAVALVGGLLVTACGGGAGGESSDGEGGKTFQIGMVGERDGGGKPQRGGTLTFAAYAEATSLDPAETIASGSTGGSALAAVYDVLVRYDPEAQKYEPQLAKSLRHSDDHRTWTLTLRDGVTFSDGTPLDAEAVVWSINRYVEQGGSQASLWSANVASMEATDPSTVVFELQRSWPAFAYMLATGPGMIVSPSSVAGEKFTPVGAGPFTLSRYAPHEELILKARTDYWGGKPYLNKLRFTWLKGAQAKLETLNAGGVDVAFLRAPEVVTEAREAGYEGFMNLNSLGDVVTINHRQGRPGSDVRVRRALAYAINPEVTNQHSNSGKGMPGKALFQDYSRWHTGTKPLPYDPAKAKKLLKTARADGYDGRITYLSPQIPAAKAEALALKAMLEKVGFSVTIDYVRSISEQIRRVYVKHDFDIASGALSYTEAAPYRRFFVSLHSDSQINAAGYDNQKMDQLIRKVQTATTEKAKRQVIAKIQRQWNKTVPYAVLGASPTFVAWQENVHGITPTTYNLLLFGNAWKGSS